MPDLPVAFHAVAADDYPLLIEYIDIVGQVVYAQLVSGPGALYVPALHKVYGPVDVKVYTGGQHGR